LAKARKGLIYQAKAKKACVKAGLRGKGAKASLLLNLGGDDNAAQEKEARDQH